MSKIPYIDTMKNCTKCQEAKPATTEFFSVSKTNKNGLSSWCKICINNKSKDIRKSSKGKEYNSNYFINGNGKLKLQEFTKNNPNTQRNSALKNKYNITLDDYNIMLFEQDGCCAICNTHHTELKQTLAVDHCHTTGNVRGLLCMHCNQALGKFKDNTKILQNAIKYLKK